MKNSASKTNMSLCRSKEKANNEAMINPITHRFCTVSCVYISMGTELVLFMRIKGENPMGQVMRPIPSHGICKQKKLSHGMGWHCSIPSGALLSPFHFSGKKTSNRSSSICLLELIQQKKKTFVFRTTGAGSENR